ncbi:hypothetical protein BDZ97DRAFT_1675363, partial [Flammula alnicola]
HQEYLSYRHLRTSVNCYLQENGLLFQHDLPRAFRIIDLVIIAMNDMQQQQMAYHFAPLRQGLTLADHEKLPFVLLSYKSRGQIRTSGSIGFSTWPIEPAATIESLFQDKRKYAPSEAFEGDRFVINFAVASLPFTGIIESRRHNCIAKRFFRQFPNDNQFKDPNNDDEHLYDSDSSGGEDEMANFMAEEEEEQSISDMLAPPPSQIQVRNSPQGPSRREESFLATSSFLPPPIWESTWNPPTPTSEVYNLVNLPEQVFAAANKGNNTVIKFEINSTTAAGMADMIDIWLTRAIENNDFTDILSPERDYQIVSRRNDLISFGDGIQRECWFNLFERYRQDPNDEWIQYRCDARASIKTVYSISTCRFIPESRITGLKKLGAICAILLILGQCPAPFDPCVFQYAVHADLEAIHPGLLFEWHPNLRAKIIQWKELGPGGDISSFDQYMQEVVGFGAPSFAHRTEAAHKAFAPAMLYHTVFGSEPPYHPEWKAFFAGFSLPCRNGFNFLSVLKSFAGGSDHFFSISWTSQIQGYDSLSPFLDIDRPIPAVAAELDPALARVQRGSAKDLIVAFLQGSGIPYPKLFDELKPSFSSLIDLSQTHTPAFRSRMFAWAATGSPFIDPGAETITVKIVNEAERNYAGCPAATKALMAQGVISFKTCSRVVQLPGPHIVRLAEQQFQPQHGAEFIDFVQAFDHWLLCQILAAIGVHTMI